ncbi:MAG: 4'-phosphopantetheinyl transferase superfamily protein [Xanthomonadales bacterium]|nr:4'-phosphopantetheinyl transferase superfamily protein [Xanthomonadales bacterium]
MPVVKSGKSGKKGVLGPTAFRESPLPLGQQALPADDQVHLWFLDLGSLAAPLANALAAPESAAFTPSALSVGQLRFLRRFYLRLLMGAYLGLPGRAVKINRSRRGKPVLDRSVHDNALEFSMAKSGDRLLIGVSNGGEVGVDLELLERRARNTMALARRYFSKAEAERLAALPAAEVDRAFLRAWACKEAVVKASGQGIANQLCRFTVETDPERAPAVLEFDGHPGGAWRLALVQPEPEYLGAVAAHRDWPAEIALRIRAFRLRAAR